MSEAKPFCISKKEVWEAYKRVKANKGAAGVDDQSIEDFEKKLKVEINSRSRFSDFVKPDTGAMLEHVRLTGDRQQLYWAMLEF